MSDKQTEKGCDHMTPCQDLTSFKKMLTGTIGTQALFTIILLSACLVTMSGLSSANDKINSNQLQVNNQLIRISSRQESIEKKVDQATNDATQALAISGKAEANIAWIREGMTEMKMMFRNKNYQQDNK